MALWGVEAGDATEMESRLAAKLAEAAASTADAACELQLAGAGAGPLWQGWFVTASSIAVGATFFPSNALVAAAVAGNPAEALLRLKQRMVANGLDVVNKVVLAGAGVGPTFMALAIGQTGI
jgi:hypothetical protein